ncbi:hypothetical protein DENIS_2756 [Desulfonema ishimotonii]|uniref:Pentapeptide repeat-containing protein n=1 Tax=Desulfonema ishimotonii TaxID=45657 RepID=A0A401FXX9_9BACT|nr:pentapeptide repeat-containing protein [Desulfonema ishimotonii]GBC61794.1 hypothetical protein DENIS_2756 [Desulfonema ishimotonii]
MKKISNEALTRITDAHELWLRSDGKKGHRADLSKTDLSGIEIPEANLVLASFLEANLSGANLLLADLSQATLTGANLSGAELSGADLLLADFSGADLAGADLSVADLSGANLSRACLAAASLPQTDFSGADLSEANLLGADLSGANLSGANLSGANLAQSRLSNVNLSGADLTQANLLLTSIHCTNFHNTALTGVTIDSLTLLQLPTEVSRKFRNTFQIIELDRSGEFMIVREMEFPEIYYRAGLSILSYFAAFLRGQYSPDEIRIRIELRGNMAALIVEAASQEIKGRIQDALEIYGLVLQGKLVADALSDDDAQIMRLESSLAYTRKLMADERRLTSPQQSDDGVANADMQWLRDHVGSLLQHPETRMVADEKYLYELIPQIFGIRKFQGVIKRLMDQNSRIRPELSTLFQKLSVRTPDGDDIRTMESSLLRIRKEVPDAFREITREFYDSGIEAASSVWGEAFSRVLDRLTN